MNSMKVTPPLFCSLLILCGTTHCRRPAEYVREEARLDQIIMDNANVLSSNEKLDLFNLVNQIEDSTSSKIAVVIIQSLKGRDINKYSIQVANRLPGSADLNDDSILITVALQDRNARIEVGIALETVVRDEIAARILSDVMFPQFVQGRIFKGLKEGIENMGQTLSEHQHQTRGRP